MDYKKLFPPTDETSAISATKTNPDPVVEDPKAVESSVQKSRYSNMFPGHDENWKAPEEKEFRPLMDSFSDPRFLAASGVLGAGTATAQHFTLPTELRKEAQKLRKEAVEYVKSGKVSPEGLTSMQRYAGGQQNAIAAQNIDPIKSTTPSVVQKNIIEPLTVGTNKMLDVSPGVQPVPGSTTGLVHTGSPSSNKSLATNNPLMKTATINAPAVSEGTNTAEKVLELSKNLKPAEQKMLESLLQKGYAVPDVLGFFGKLLSKTAVPLAVASIPEQANEAYEYARAGDIKHALTSGAGALGGVALGAGAGLAAMGAAPAITTGLGIAGTAAGIAPLAHAAYDWYKGQ